MEDNELKKTTPIFGGLFSNFYFWAAAVFVLWIAFFDSNNLIEQYKLRSQLVEMEEQKQFYLKQIEEVARQKEELSSDPAKFEKYAREKYFFKKEGEEIFVVDEDRLAED